MRAVRFALGGLVAFSIFYGLAAGLGGLIPHRLSGQKAPEPGTRIYLLQGPIHYDFLLPLNADTRARFSFLERAGFALGHPAAEWLVIGWGAEAFYTSTGSYSDVSLAAIGRGVFGDRSVMRVELAGAVQPNWPVRKVDLGAGQYARLTDAIRGSFGPSTKPLDLAGFSPTDMFFPARGRFNLFQTCNVWIGDMMRAAGVRFGIWTPTPYAVTLAHSLHVSN